MPEKQVVIEDPDSSNIRAMVLVFNDSGAITHVQMDVKTDTEIPQVYYEPNPTSLIHEVTEFSNGVRDGLDLLPDEAIAIFRQKESFASA